MRGLVLRLAVAACLSGCTDPDLYICNRPEMCSRSADAINAQRRAFEAEQQAETNRQTQKAFEDAAPERARRQAEDESAYKAWFASLTPEQRRQYRAEQWATSIEIQRRHDAVDNFNSALGISRQCSPQGCW